MTKAYEPKTWTAAQVRERLRTGKPLHPDDLVRSDGRVTNPDGEALECGAWVTTVDLYLEMIRAECAEDGCCTGEDADHVDAELARPQYDD